MTGLLVFKNSPPLEGWRVAPGWLLLFTPRLKDHPKALPTARLVLVALV